MSQLPSDTIYRDLKQKGLQLSSCTKITIPEIQPVKSGIVKRLSTMVMRKKQQQIQLPMKIVQVQNSGFLVIKKNVIYIYKITINQNKGLDVSSVQNISLKYDVLQVYVANTKYLQDRDFPMIFQSKDSVNYVNLDMKQLKFTQRNSIKLPNLIGIGWISDKQCIFLDNKNIHHYSINSSILKQKTITQAKLVISQTQYIQKTWIMANVDQQQDSIITIFYAILQKTVDPISKFPSMVLRVKQLVRTPNGDIFKPQKSDYVLETQSLHYRDMFNINSVGDYYCLQLASQILVMKKKFDKYLLLDNMVEIMKGFEVKLNKKGIIVSIGQKLLQLNCIHFGDPKCTSRICDVIQFPQQLNDYHGYFKQIWPVLNQKQYTLIFVFVKQAQRQITLCNLIKMQPMYKMMELAKKKPKQNLQVIQDMALNLGITRRDFYLKLWKTSKKQNSHIYQYLLPCKDVDSIKKQLNNTLRTRVIQVSQVIKILEKIQQINLQNLKQNLNIKNLTQYVKNHFLKRKILLNAVDKNLDHRIFQTIYNSSLQKIFIDIVSDQLDPVQPKFDPLHSNIAPPTNKQLKSLQNVFQTFKVVLLEDYKLFLRKFLSKFPNKILQVLKRFNFLLPNHPFEIEVQKPSKTNQPILKQPVTNGTIQPLWFQPVVLNQWQGQLTKQSILRQLFQDYPTSKITQTIDQFYNSTYGKQNKRWKHGLITLSLDQYAKKIKSLNGVQLYLDICEFANQLSVQNDGDPKISQQIIQVLKQKNKLTQPDINFCRLYANMHYFMLKNKIVTKNKLDISYLSNLKPESLVAIFFLENKQRKQHIFRDFKDLYEDKNQFKQVLQKFVQSENCSRIQLQILMNEMIDKGEKFQQQNQQLIQLLIEGICMKVQIRESLLILDCDQDDENAGCLIDEIQLSKHLALKVNRIKQLKRCKSIFKSFQFQKMTYKQLLDLQRDNQIFKLLLSKYFELRDDQTREGEFQVVIQQQKINLQSPRNLLTVLVYLQQTIYYSASSFQILLIFGLQMFLWKQFDVMKQLIADQAALQTLGVQKYQYLETLIMRGLQQIYLDPEIIYDEQTKEQIINIISVDPQMSPLKVRQIAKLDLVDIFTGWGLQVAPSDIHCICQMWKAQNRQKIIVDLIQKYVQNINFAEFHEIYKLLQIVDKETTQISHKNTQYVRFCDIYARKLLKHGKYQQVVQILVFLMNIPVDRIDYPMLAQTYLQNIVQIYSQDEQICRRFIQFFVQKYDTSENYSIKQLLQSYFDEAVLGLWERSPTIVMNYQYNFDQSKKIIAQIPLDDLWEIAKKHSENTRELCYNYFFLAMGLTTPKKGFGETVGISYNLEQLTNMITGDLDAYFQSHENLWLVNYSVIQAIFLFEGMIGEAAHCLEINLGKQRKSKFDIVIKQLRNRRAQNQKNQNKLLTILAKLKSQIFSKSKVNAKKQRYQIKMKQLKDKQLQKNKQEQSIQIQPVQQSIQKPEVYLRWRRVQSDKRAISNISQYLMSQKDLIDQVYEINYDSKKQIEVAQKPKQKKTNTFQNLFLPKKGIERIQHILDLIKNRKYQQLGTMPKNSVLQALQKAYNEDNNQMEMQIVDILDLLHIGDPQKKQIFRVAKIFLQNLSNQTRKTLFPIQFFTTPIHYGQAESHDKYAAVYKQLTPRIRQIVRNIGLGQLKQLANLMNVILQSSQYSARVYYEALLHIGLSASFDSNSVLMAQQCIDGMGDYPQIVSKNYAIILQSMTFDKQMKPYVRENLAKLMSQKHYSEVAEWIKTY